MRLTLQNAIQEIRSVHPIGSREPLARASVEAEDSVLDTSSIESQDNTINTSVETESAIVDRPAEYPIVRLTRLTKYQIEKALNGDFSNLISPPSDALQTRYNLRKRK